MANLAGGSYLAGRHQRFLDASGASRCEHTIVLKDKSEARCGRRKAVGSNKCWQHTKYLGRKS